MSELLKENDAVKSYLEMSDEEVSKLPPPNMEDFTGSQFESANDPLAQENKEEPEETSPDPEDEALEAKSEEAEDALEVASTEPKEQPEDEANSVTEINGTNENIDAGNAPEISSTIEVNYKSEYEKVFAPFKANGREIAIKSAEDAISLMQMGANYNKKMAALKPNLQLMKLLEKNGLLDESKLSYLIDLDKKNPEAISKLIKDSGIDPLDLDAEKASGYKPNTYTVNERELELDTVLEDIESTPTYTRTLEVVGNKWDGASKRAVAEAPQLLKVINGHMSNGVYDIISAEVDRERTFGRLNGLSDIEAYKEVGDAIQARNGFDHLFKNSGNQAPIAPKNIATKPTAEDSDKLRDKKRAASSTKPAAAKSEVKEFNPLSMSDEEFSKQGIDKFL